MKAHPDGLFANHPTLLAKYFKIKKLFSISVHYLIITNINLATKHKNNMTVIGNHKGDSTHIHVHVT
jgi:hypothetical protein